MAVSHTLWVINLAGRIHLTQNQSQKLDKAIELLNAWYFNDIVADYSGTVTTARAALAPSTGLALGANDAVVHIVKDVDESVIAKNVPGSKLPSDPSMLGLTVGPSAGAFMCEVYWSRGNSSGQMAGAIFHEAAHGLSKLIAGMHTYQKPYKDMGSQKVHVLAEKGGKFDMPNESDLDFYANHIASGAKFKKTI